MINWSTSPVKRHYMSGNIPDTYTKCLNKKETLLHCLWEYPKIQNFLNDVIRGLLYYHPSKWLSCVSIHWTSYKPGERLHVDKGTLRVHWSRKTNIYCWGKTGRDCSSLGTVYQHYRIWNVNLYLFIYLKVI